MNKSWEFLKRPRGVFLVVVYFLTAIFCALSIFLALKGGNETVEILSYIIYAFAAVTLFYSVYSVAIYAPRLKDTIKKLLESNKITKRVMENYGYKTTLFSLCSTVITLTVVAMNAVSAIRYSSFWYATLATYYFVLLLFRGVILFFNDRVEKSKTTDAKIRVVSYWKIYLFVGAFLVFLELSMTAVVVTMLSLKRPVPSGQIMAIATAAYAFYKMGTAIYNVFKARKFQLPAIQAIRNVNFADACISIFSLTVLLCETFGESESNVYLKALSGFFCLAAVIFVASVMIIRANKNIKRLINDL